MERFMVCDNPGCRFILDRRINGKSRDGAQLVLKKCPACGGDWSAACPSCNQPLATKLVAGLPHSVCCDRSASGKSRAA
jgi:hypothetical protein